MTYNHHNGLLAAVVVLIGFGLLLSACDETLTAPDENSAPNTTLANIPEEGDTLFALATLHWDGEDDDGFVAGYEYRYITHHVQVGDSVATDWQPTEATSLTIAFESSDELNLQVFQVRAIDNSGDADPTPAQRRFFTRKTIFPETEIVEPADGSVFFALEAATDWWEGINLAMTANDADGDVMEYAWAVDDGEWTWTTDTTLFIPPDAFASPLEGEHEIRVTSRDNTNLIDPTGESTTVRLIRPSHDRGILIVDETLEGSFPVGVDATDAAVDQFYADLFGVGHSWDYSRRGAPPKDTLGQYQLVVWHADNSYSSRPHELPQHVETIQDYLNTGGDFIMSGWRILKSFAPAENFPLGFSDGTFVHDYLHINAADETPLGNDFDRAIGVDEFSDIEVDSVKLANSFPYYGRLGQVNVIPERGGFTKVIYSYDGNLPSYRGTAVGLRYFGTSFDAAVLGFPIFFIKEEHARTLANELLANMGY